MDTKFKNYLILSKDFLIERDTLRAKNSLQKAYNYASNSDEKISVLFELADLVIEEEEFLKAKNYYEIILNIEEQAGAYYGLAMTGEFLGKDLDYSIKNYKKAIDLDKNYDRAHYYLAHVYDKIGNVEEAIYHLKKVIEIKPDDFISLNDLGSIYEVLDEDELAKNYVEKSLEVNPNYGRALFNRGVLYKKENKNDLALKVYYKAIDNFISPYLFLNMSAIYIEEKNYKEALKILNEGLRRHDNSVNLHYNKACVLNIINKTDGAIEELKSAININSDAKKWASTDPDLIDIVGEI